jgi:hypothetical protein
MLVAKAAERFGEPAPALAGEAAAGGASEAHAAAGSASGTSLTRLKRPGRVRREERKGHYDDKPDRVPSHGTLRFPANTRTFGMTATLIILRDIGIPEQNAVARKRAMARVCTRNRRGGQL